MPDLQDIILFIEDDHLVKIGDFDRDLQSLIHQPDFEGVRGIVIGRFQVKSEITTEELVTTIKNKPELEHLPVVANVDFGHTNPLITFPIGGTATLSATKDKVEIKIAKH